MIGRRATLLQSVVRLFTDLNQGAMPALVPFFVAQYDLSYQQAAGLVFAATFASSVVQPLFGRYADRFSAAWLMPVGILAAGLGLALTGVMTNYWLMSAVLMPGAGRGRLSSRGRALDERRRRRAQGHRHELLFHGRHGRLCSRPADGHRACSPLACAARCSWRCRRWAWPLRSSTSSRPARAGVRPKRAARRVAEAPRPVGPLWAAQRGHHLSSVLFFGFNTFLPLYWIDILGQSPAAGGTILSLWLGSGVIGSLPGGRLADLYGARAVGIVTSLLIVPLMLAFALPRSAALRWPADHAHEHPASRAGQRAHGAGPGLPAQPHGRGLGRHHRPLGQRGGATAPCWAGGRPVRHSQRPGQPGGHTRADCPYCR